MTSERSRVIFTLKSTADWRLWDAVIRDEPEPKNLLHTIDDKEGQLNIGRDDIPAEARKKVDNAAARAILRANLSIEQAEYVEGLTTAKDIYETLRKIHTSQSEAGVWQLLQQLINIIGMTDKTVDEKSQQLVRAQTELNKMALKDISVSKTFLSIFLSETWGLSTRRRSRSFRIRTRLILTALCRSWKRRSWNCRTGRKKRENQRIWLGYGQKRDDASIARSWDMKRECRDWLAMDEGKEWSKKQEGQRYRQSDERSQDWPAKSHESSGRRSNEPPWRRTRRTAAEAKRRTATEATRKLLRKSSRGRAKRLHLRRGSEGPGDSSRRTTGVDAGHGCNEAHL
ncbi:hypothetical protein EJ06DRAFT_325909 [Trichodelitschia bisporula]|uniref:Uncharacterized protein n=1 Tax=Trichodelitschia bisporula TaxID=703511 RepID=A0A6G1I5M0_9PEZI|nr:hypothetical protein EJ06DRAFT_325909 [Trichodelitschia bisporula]